MVAIPLSIAIAIASGAPPAAGLVTAVVAGFFVSAVGGSRVQIGGPTGAFIVVVYGIIASHGYDGLVLATLMAGGVLVVAAVLRAGGIVALVPGPVIEGFTIGIGIVIATSQLRDFFGLTTAALPAEFFAKVAALWQARSTVNGAALAVGVLAVAIIFGLRRVAPRWPGLIVAVAIASALAAFMPVDTIGSRYGALPAGLPMPHWPALSTARLLELAPSALVIAFLAGLESLLSAVVADRMMGGAYRPNAELMAQGVANVASALFGGLPATGALARTATNVRAGGRTPVAGIVAAATVLLVMIVAAPLAAHLAMPALAALLLVTAWTMTEPQRWGAHLAGSRADLAVLLLTLVLTVLADLAIALIVGTAVGQAVQYYRRRAATPL